MTAYEELLSAYATAAARTQYQIDCGERLAQLGAAQQLEREARAAVLAAVRQPQVEVRRIDPLVHLEAHKLGFYVELYPESVAGHGLTGRLKWAITSPTATAPQFRYGTAANHESAVAQLSDELRQISRDAEAAEVL